MSGLIHHERRAAGCLFTSDPALVDFRAVHAFLTRAYWCEGISRELVERAAANSVVFGVYDGGAQVGYARVITDRATYAYLADVYILESHRGRGLAKLLVEHVLSHPELQGLRRFALMTRDAHGLYARFGFRAMEDPSRSMEIVRKGLYGASRG